MKEHRQYGDRISDRPGPREQALMLDKHSSQTIRHRLTPHPQMPVTRQPAQIRRQHRAEHPDPLVIPADPSAGHRRGRELHRVLRLDQLIRTHIQHHDPAVPAAHEVIRRVTDPPAPAVTPPRQPKRLRDQPAHLRLSIQPHQVAQLHPRLVTHQIRGGRSPVPTRKIALPPVRRESTHLPSRLEPDRHITSSGPPHSSPPASTYSSQKSSASTSHPQLGALNSSNDRRERRRPLPQVDRDTAPDARD